LINQAELIDKLEKENIALKKENHGMEKEIDQLKYNAKE
jgi:cell division protein FtsB